jgi:hypothetical protein
VSRLFRFGRGTGVKRVTIPDLSGLTKTEIETLLDSLGISYSSTASNTEDSGLANKYKSQSVAGGSTILRGSSISFEYYSYTAPPYFPPYFPYFPSFIPTPYVALGYTDNGTGITLQWSTAGGPSATSVSFGGSLAAYVSNSVNNGGTGYADVNSPYGQSGNLNVTIQTAYGSATSNTVDYTNYHTPPAPPSFTPDFTPAPPSFTPDFTPAPPSFTPDFTPAPPDFTPVPPYFKGSKGPGCIYADTRVLTLNRGYVAAKDLLMSDSLISIDPSGFANNTIINNIVSSPVRLADVKIASLEKGIKDVVGFNNRETFYSEAQPIIVERDNVITYVKAGEILLGDTILNIDVNNNIISNSVVESIETKSSVEVYDIRTTPYQWYVVENTVVVS